MANLITIFRIFLIFISAFLLFHANTNTYILAIVLIIIAFALDGLDGYVARKFNESSKLGAMLDIMSDRIAENTLWVVFAVLGWLPIVFPLITLTRSFLVDGIRSVAMEYGYTAFGQTSMQKDIIGHFICSSKFSRIIYAVAKAVAFILIIVANTPGVKAETHDLLAQIAYGAAVTAIELCVIRGLPVIFESKKFFIKKDILIEKV